MLEKLPSGILTQFGCKLVDISSADGQPGAMCTFADGSVSGPFDLVIGCDGIKSAVKDRIENGKVAEGDTGIYSGI